MKHRHWGQIVAASGRSTTLRAALVIALGTSASWAGAQTRPDQNQGKTTNTAVPAAPAAANTDATGDDVATTADLGTLDVTGQVAGGDTVPPAYAGGQVALGGRIGALGEQSAANVPFSVISFTDQLMANQQASTVADVLINDAAVQTAYGYGNFAELFQIRGFTLNGEDISFGGLYGVLPRQIVQTSFVDRVELFKGANAFTKGVSPTGSGVGGAVNLEPKRATNDPITQFRLGYISDSGLTQFLDIGRRYGHDKQFGVRLSARHEKGDTAIDGENLANTSVGLGLDYRGERARLSFDFGYQRQHVKHGRFTVYTTGYDDILTPPDASTNYAPSFNTSELESEFGMLRGEYDLTDHWTTYAAIGANHSEEQGQYGSPTPYNAAGDATISRLGVPFESHAFTGQAGVRGDFDTGPLSHNVTLGYSGYYRRTSSAYTLSDTTQTNIYDPPDIGYLPTLYQDGDLDDPNVRSRTRASGVSLSDTVGAFDDRVLLTLGGRYQAAHVYNYDYDGIQNGEPLVGHKITPLYGIVYKPTDWASLYANHIESLQPGDTAPTAAINAGQVIGLVEAKQNEVGAKLDFGNIGGSLALYQIEKPQAYLNAANVYGYFGEQRNRGIELSVYGKPTERLRLLASGTYIDAEQRDTGDSTLDGNDAIGVPEYRLVFTGDWQLDDAARWYANARVIHSGKQYADPANNLKLDEWTRVDLGLRYEMPFQGRDKGLVWRAGVKNVADSDYWAAAQGGYLSQGGPRTFNVSATYNFD